MKIISNLTLVPTFEMVGDENIESGLAERINNFVYSEQNIFCMNFALDGAPQFASADFDDGIQRCFMGYFGGKDSKEFERFNRDLINGIIHETHMANWFIPTLADPPRRRKAATRPLYGRTFRPPRKHGKKGP